ncbi:hypothetical protein [Actinoplanes sp. NPDC026623]|uniref:hypothetical protein n=1 Tax=Actinoplanes sp. NPDC026623 TaxID=3155610 RepID=UPI0033F18BA1
MIIGGVVVAIAALVATIGIVAAHGPAPAPAQAVGDLGGSAGTTTATSRAPVDSPHDLILATLNRGAAALLEGDEAGWLAIVDPAKPKVRAYYRQLYTSLRGLGVTQLAYQTLIPKPVGWEDASWDEDFYLTYCFSRATCPKFMYLDPSSPGAPMITQGLTIRRIADREYRITTVDAPEQATEAWASPPWQVTPLVLAKGRRVTVAAGRGDAKRIKEVLAAAERAAGRADHYAGLVGNPQPRYRVYMATDKQWRTWFGGHRDTWAIGYSTFPHATMTEIILKMSAAGSGTRLQRLIQHEMGHAVTLGGVDVSYQYISNPLMWLQEGIAEYIAYAPRPATASSRLPEIRAALRGSRRPASIVLRQLSGNAGLRESSVFYGLSHFAVGCLAHKYGERKLFDFVSLVLREQVSVDKASARVFGTPFRPVDRACRSWIQQQV